MKSHLHWRILVALLAVAIVPACKDDDDPPPIFTAPPTGEIYLGALGASSSDSTNQYKVIIEHYKMGDSTPLRVDLIQDPMGPAPPGGRTETVTIGAFSALPLRRPTEADSSWVVAEPYVGGVPSWVDGVMTQIPEAPEPKENWMAAVLLAPGVPHKVLVGITDVTAP